MIVGKIAAWLAPAALKGAFGFIVGNMRTIAIAGAAVVVAFGAGSVVGHLRGYNAAITKCKAASLNRRINELQRDVSIAQNSASSLARWMSWMNKRDAEREQGIAKDETKISQRSGCAVPADADRWLRHGARQR